MEKKFIRLVGAAALSVAAIAGAHAQNVPSTVRVVVGYPAGAALDIVARIAADHLAKELNTSVIVENVAGAGGALALNKVVNGPADGSLILLASVNDVMLDVQSGTTKTQQSLAPLGTLALIPAVLIGRTNLPAANVDELVKLAREPGKQLSIGGSGTGTMTHLQVAGLQRDMKTRLNYIPYKGAAITMTDVIGGNVDLALVGLPSVLPYLNSPKFRVYGVISPKRSSLAPQIPTLLESESMRDSRPFADSWCGLMVSAKLPPDLQKAMAAAVAKVSGSEAVRQQIRRIGLDPDASSAEELRRQVQHDLGAFAAMFKVANIKIE